LSAAISCCPDELEVAPEVLALEARREAAEVVRPEIVRRLDPA
jgi:hypothetical protein